MCQFKNHIEVFSTFEDESHESQMQNLKKKADKNLLNTIAINCLFFIIAPLFTVN